MINNDSENKNKTNGTINGTLSTSRMVNSDASYKDISIFNNIDFSDIDFASVANVIH